MKQLFTLLLAIFLCSFSYGQTYKTLKDSVFKKGDIIKIPLILYYDGRIASETKDSLNLIGDFLNRHKNLIVQIACHTDSRGSTVANLKLSAARAYSIQDYLAYQLKVDTAFVKYKGYGESKPIISDAKIQKVISHEEKEKLYAINRRTELIVLDVKMKKLLEPLQVLFHLQSI